jgi:hypothetical protein
MCQYLFAAFSLKQREDEGLTADALEAVPHWRKAIAHVATEEMLHLALVQNLLSAIGAAPHLAARTCPRRRVTIPSGVNLTLVPFGEPALRHRHSDELATRPRHLRVASEARYFACRKLPLRCAERLPDMASPRRLRN